MKESGMCEQPTVIRTCKGRTHGGCEQPPVIRTRVGHVRTTTAHSRMHGPDSGGHVRTTAGCSHMRTVNRRLFAHARIAPMHANNRRLVGHTRGGPKRATCEQPPSFAHAQVGPTADANSLRLFARARLRGTSANNRWLLAHEDSQPLAFCTCKGRTYARDV